MELCLNRTISRNFEPPVHSLLRKLPSNSTYHKEHNLRHPAAIYFLSLEKISKSFIRVAELYQFKRYEYRHYTGREIERAITFDLSDLLHEQETLLRALQEHLDDCYLILKTLIDPKTTRKNPLFADRYIEENKLLGAKTFMRSVLPVKQSLVIANKLKHQQGLLQSVLLVPNSHIGYYLETPSADGALGPSPEVHPDQNCFSFARDLAVRLFNIYLTSEILSKAISGVVAPCRWINDQPVRDRTPLAWDKVIELATQLPPLVFPREYSKGTPTFRLTDNGNVLTLKASDRTVKQIDGKFALWLKLTRDGYSDKLLQPIP